ncbi:MAG: transcriptional repressor LexA [Deltaproteobacteria bacterium]
MRDRGLTSRQKEILDFLKAFIGENGYPPSLRDICARFGIKGPQNAAKHLASLERKGFIKRSSNISRAIEVVGHAVNGALTLPIAGRVRAGAPHLAVEDIIGHVALDERFFRCRGAFLLKVEGRSMIGAGIEEGDYIIVRPQSDALDNDIVVALIDAEATVKRFSRKGRGIILKPENPAMEPIEIKDGDRPFSIIGKVISVIKQIER